MDFVEHFMNTNPNVTKNMIGRWFDIPMNENRVQGTKPKNNQTEEKMRPIEKIAHGSWDMADAVKKVKQI